jgi:O-antigen/teichoic acid export membrane protein
MFRAFEKFEYTALITVVERSVTVPSALLVLFLGYGLYEVSLVFLAGSFVMLILSFVIVHRRFARFTRDVHAAEAAEILRLTIPFGAVNAVATFTNTAGPVLLTIMQGLRSTGLFNAAFTLWLALFSFLSLASVAALPMMSRIYEESPERLPSVLSQIQRLSLLVGVPMALGGWLYAGPIVTAFWGPAYQESARAFQVLVLGFAVETAVMGIGPALAATGHARDLLYISSVGAGFLIAMSVLLIPPLGILGVALAFLVSRIAFAVLGIVMIRRYVAPLAGTATLAKSIIAGLVMLIVLLAVPGLPLWTGVLSGGLMYFVTLISINGLTKEDRTVVWNAVRGALFR